MKKFSATKESGCAACVFGVSIVPELCRIAPKLIDFSLPFWAYTLPIDGHHHGDEWIDDDAYRRGTQQVLAHVRQHSIGYFTTLAQQITTEADEFLMRMRELRPLLPHLDDDELVRQYKAFITMYTQTMSPGICTFLYEGYTSEYLTTSLGKRHGDVGALLGKLLRSPYKSYMVRNETALRRIARATTEAQRRALIVDYLDAWFFVDTDFFHAPQPTPLKVLRRARSLAHKPQQRSASHHINLTPEERRLVNLLRVTETIHDQRKRINQIGGFILFRFLDEAVRRTGIPRAITQNAFWFEFERIMAGSPAFLKRLKKRRFMSIVYANKKVHYSERNIIEPKRVDTTASTIHGTPASSGRTIGTIRVVLGHRQFSQFKKGEILVSEMTRPDFVPVLKKAAAIVTDEGGLTCHAAVISRELNIPCIVGTKIATRALKDGDTVEVDATKGTVTKLTK